jgi:hypothetical protein
LTKNLEAHHVPAKFVPGLLTDEQKVNHLMVSQQLFDHSNTDEDFLKMS